MAAANTNTDLAWSRDEAADANPDLTRKRQRLSEEADTSPRSVHGDDVVIEALPPEDAGTSFDTAIALDDESAMDEVLSDSFDLAPGSNYTPVAQLNFILRELDQRHCIEHDFILRLTQWISGHVADTDSQIEAVLEKYCVEHEFFSKLGQTCFAILEFHFDLFTRQTVQSWNSHTLTGLVASFHDAVHGLSVRMLRLLPSLVDNTIARRDSGQVSKARQHVDLLWYALILGQTLCCHRAHQSLGFCRSTLDYKPKHSAYQRRAAFFQRQDTTVLLLSLLKQLTQHHRELTNAWESIETIFRIFMHHDLVIPGEDARTLMDITHMHILPVICDKHPRALPDGFHELSVQLASGLLRRLAQDADCNGLALLYEGYIRDGKDALTTESIPETSVEQSLQDVSAGDQATLVELLTTAWTLATLRSFIYSDIMDVRSTGITLLSGKLLQLYNAHRVDNDNFDHPVLQYVARFMRANELTKYIFGPNSHASLVNHSQNIIGFLAATFAYTNLESDIIWHACTNSVEADFVKASFTVLVDLCRYLDLDHLLYLAEKYTSTPPSKLGKDAVDSLSDLFQKLQLKSGESNDQKHRLATAFISIDIMMRVTNAWDHPLLAQLRDTARNELGRFRNPPYSAEDRTQIFARCVPHVVNANQHATTSVEVLTTFLPSVQSPQEAQDLLNMLPLQAVVDELGHYVQSHRESGDGQQPGIIGHNLQLRVGFIVRLMALPGAAMGDATRSLLFRHTVGDLALNNIARDICWNTLMLPGYTGNLALAAQDLVRHFVANEAFSLDLQYMTPSLIKLLGSTLQSLASHSDVLEAPAWQKLVQAAESVGAPQVSQQATGAICDILFEYPRHSEKTRAAAVKFQTDFARQQVTHIREAFANLELNASGTIAQKVLLLDAIVQKSREFPSSAGSDHSAEIRLATQPEDELFECALQVYCGGQTQPKLRRLQANSSTTVSELMAKLPALTGAAESRVIVGGKALDPESQSGDTLSRLGVQASGGILISPKHTIESDLGVVLTLPGTVEQEVLNNFNDLERLLDGPDDIASKAYHFLATIPPPTQVRQRIASADTLVDELFPPTTRPWRSAYSLHVLDVHRKDFAKIGVADDGFIQQGARLLVATLINSGRPLHHPIIQPALSTLTHFLQERPVNASMVSWIEQPTAFVDRLIDICNFAVQYPRQGNEPRPGLLEDAFKALFQAFRVQDSVWQSFTGSPRVADMHKNVLFAHGDYMTRDVPALIKDFFADASLPDDVADFYARSLLAILPDALLHGHCASQYFLLTIDAILTNKVMRSDEIKAREVMSIVISTLWSYQHTETVDLPVLDHAMFGLLNLLAEVVQIVKSFKKPLALSGFPVRLLAQLLFPPYQDPDSKPLIDPLTRSCAYSLVQATCETEADFAGIMESSLVAMKDTNGNPQEKFSGLADWLRPATNCSGLTNLGMTCYMNSLLQQLFANVRFRKFIFEVPIVDSEKQGLLREMQKLFAEMQDSYCRCSDPSALAKVLGIQIETQEDVHSFYEGLLARLELNMPDETWRSKLNRFYTGKQLSQIKGECEHVSPKTEPFVDLAVVVKNKTNLTESLAEFVQGEPMQGANKYKCQACDPADGGRLVDAMRRACPEEIPDSLTFCLKRFTFEAMFGVEGKVNDRFEFPQSINMTPYKAASLDSPASAAEDDIFELVGVIVHQGTLNLGHYWSYTLLRNTELPLSRTWVKLEDRNVSVVEHGIHEVQQECFGGQRYMNGNERVDNAYVLFYERRASLEERLALPSIVVDPSTQALLPPKVPLPPHLSTAIRDQNAWRFRIGHLFHEDFAKFVSWQVDHYKLNHQLRRLDPPKSATSADSDTLSDAEGSARSLVSDEELAADTLVQKTSDVVMAYFQRIAPCENIIPGRRLGSWTYTMASLLTDQPDFAILFLNRIVGNLSWFEKAMAHEEKKVRGAIGDFIFLCLTRIRELDEAFYHRAFDSLAQTHSKSLTMAQSLDWGDHLKFAACLASLGQWETERVLEEGYWQWAFELLYDTANTKKKYQGLTEHFRQNPTKVAALYEFIYSILDNHVDICTSLTDPEPNGIHTRGHDGLVLADDEASYLDEIGGKRVQALRWIYLSKFTKQDGDWQDSAAGKLVGLLCSRRSTSDMATKVQQSLINHIESDEEHLPTLVSMTMHYCQNCSSEDDAHCVFKVLAKVIHQWDGADKEFLKVLPDAYNMVPHTVMVTMEVWSPVFLDAKPVQRDETAKFLQDKVFGVAPLSDDPDLEADRVRQARRLVRDCAVVLKDAWIKDRLRSRFLGVISLVSAIDAYLQKLQDEFHALNESAPHKINIKLRTEMDEIPQTMAFMRDLNGEVLAHWQLELVGTQDVRASVEASEDFISSEEWDDDDDESIALD